MDIKDLVQVGNIRWLIFAAKNNPTTKNDYLEILNLSKEQTYDPHSVVSIQSVQKLHELIKQCSYPAYALLTGKDLLIGEYGVIDYICLSSETILQSIETLHKYFKVVVPSTTEFIIATTSSNTRIEIIVDSILAIKIPWYEQLGVEFSFSLYLSRIRKSTGCNISPVALSFKHSKPDYHETVTKLFNSDISYDASSNSMTFDNEVLSLKQKYTADKNMYRAFHQCANAALSKVSTIKTLKHKVLQILEAELKKGNSTINCVLEQLNVTERTLHRKLENEGTTYSELRDSLIKSLAKTYLKNPKITIAQISCFLGYSTPSSFYRSFKRLTGISPTKYREKINDLKCY